MAQISTASGLELSTVSVPADGAVALSSNGSSCPWGGCTSYWSLTCPDGRGSFANRSGDAVTITVSSIGNGSADVSVAGAKAAFNCERERREGRMERHAGNKTLQSTSHHHFLVRPAPCMCRYCDLGGA